MGCNCRKANDKNCQWIYTSSRGEQQVYSSEIQAKAARLRDNGAGSIRMEC